MKNFSLKPSKKNLAIIGCVCIVALLAVNRYKVYTQANKTIGLYINWTTTHKVANIAYMLNFVENDSLFVQTNLKNIHTPYSIVYKENNTYKLKQLDYRLNKDSGTNILLLINKNNSDNIKIFTFLSFILPYLITTLMFCGVWVLIIQEFYRNR